MLETVARICHLPTEAEVTLEANPTSVETDNLRYVPQGHIVIYQKNLVLPALQIQIVFQITMNTIRFVGSRDGAVVRALASNQCDPGSIPGPGVHMWVEFVVGFRRCSKGFSPGSPVFLPS